ncbi:MAG: hypothetical protein M5U15_06810 [Kiritimatiellae bacterium]|nr:hypothetical protein [Kiritimatiellia bacterium]
MNWKSKVALILTVVLAVGISYQAYRAYKRVTKKHSTNQWSIGIIAGPHPLALEQSSKYPNPRFTADDIPNPEISFVADPFLLEENGKWFLFFEMFDKETRLGEIGAATSDDGFHWKFAGTVLEEPFHLSYPFVIKEGDTYYMIPESRAAREVRLYKAVDFPTKWEFDRVLFPGNYTDPTPVSYEGTWWIFTTRHPYALDIWYADELHGEWKPHKRNPIYRNDKSRARNGGRPVVLGDKILRFAQDNREGYGRKLRAFLIDVLSEDQFEEHAVTPDPLLFAHGDSWAKGGMHHYAPVMTLSGMWYASIDGWGDWAREPIPDSEIDTATTLEEHLNEE